MTELEQPRVSASPIVMALESLRGTLAQTVEMIRAEAASQIAGMEAALEAVRSDISRVLMLSEERDLALRNEFESRFLDLERRVSESRPTVKTVERDKEGNIVRIVESA